MVLVVKNPPTRTGDIRDMGSFLGLRRYPGGGHGNPLQCSCLENPMNRGTWRAIVHRVTKSQTQLKRLSTHAHKEAQKGKNKKGKNYYLHCIEQKLRLGGRLDTQLGRGRSGA